MSFGGNAEGVGLMGLGWWCVSSALCYPLVSIPLFLPLCCLKGVTKTISLWKENWLLCCFEDSKAFPPAPLTETLQCVCDPWTSLNVTSGPSFDICASIKSFKRPHNLPIPQGKKLLNSKNTNKKNNY